jgi:hypothetical protein
MSRAGPLLVHPSPRGPHTGAGAGGRGAGILPPRRGLHSCGIAQAINVLEMDAYFRLEAAGALADDNKHTLMHYLFFQTSLFYILVGNSVRSCGILK